MNTLPVKRPETEPAPVEIEETPTWRELRERTADLMKELVHEGKELERELEPKILPALQRLKVQLEKLIARLEERIRERKRPAEPGP